MRIGLIAPPWVPVPPRGYGGTEEVVDLLALGLRKRGHDVVLFTTGDATCAVDRLSVFDTPPDDMNSTMPECRHVQAAYEALDSCDVLHDHTTVGPIWAQATGVVVPVVVTVHNPFTEVSRPVIRDIAGFAAVVAISHSHRAAAGDTPIAAVIPHGIDASRIPPGSGNGGYAVFLGRFAPEKGAAEAISIARRSGVRLVIAAKMRTAAEFDYFETRIKPELGPSVEFIGEVTRAERDALLGDAVALINPITWAEPFGLVMIEALAAGTPVIAFPNGAAPEIVSDGQTGYLCADEDAAVEALTQIHLIDRSECRATVEGYYSADRMVSDYEALYARVSADVSTPGHR